MTSQSETLPWATAGLDRASILGRCDTQTFSPNPLTAQAKPASAQAEIRNPIAMRAAIRDLTIEASLEAAHITSVTTRHFVEQMEIGDLWAAEHSLGVAVRHLREAAASFRAWQALKASAAGARS